MSTLLLSDYFCLVGKEGGFSWVTPLFLNMHFPVRSKNDALGYPKYVSVYLVIFRQKENGKVIKQQKKMLNQKPAPRN